MNNTDQDTPPDNDFDMTRQSYDDDIANVDFSIENEDNTPPPASDDKPDDKSDDKSDDKKFSLRDKAFNKQPDDKSDDDKSDDKKGSDDKSDDSEDYTAPPEDSPHRPEWDKLKSAHSETKQLLETTQAELNKFKSGEDGNTTSLKSRIAELEKQNEEFSTRLKATDFKNHPEYIEKFEKPIQDTKSELLELAKLDELEINVDSLMELKGREFSDKVSEILKDLSDFNATEFSAKAREAYKLIAARDAASADSDKFVQEANQRNEAKVRETFDNVSKTYGNLVDQMAVPDGASDEEKQQIAELNQAIQGISKNAEQLAFNASSDEDVATMAHNAAVAPILVNHIIPRLEAVAEAEITARDEKIAALTEQLRKFDDSVPRYQSHDSKPAERRLEDLSTDELVNQVQFNT